MIATAIALYMQENGIKQSFLSEKTGLTKHCISFALKGKRKLNVEEYEMICDALGVSCDYFYIKSRELVNDKSIMKEKIK